MAIGFKLKKTERVLFCASKWWGDPDFPEQMEYPTVKVTDEDGDTFDYPLTFICQINCEDIAAFKALLPGSSVLRQDKTLHSILCGTLIEIAGLAKVGEMECLPDRDAAETCFKSVCK